MCDAHTDNLIVSITDIHYWLHTVLYQLHSILYVITHHRMHQNITVYLFNNSDNNKKQTK